MICRGVYLATIPREFWAVCLYTNLSVLLSVAKSFGVLSTGPDPPRKREMPLRVTGSIKYGLNVLFSVASKLDSYSLITFTNSWSTLYLMIFSDPWDLVVSKMVTIRPSS